MRLAKKASARSVPYTVIPRVVGDEVVCECGARMTPWNFVAFPSQRRSILWRCDDNADHVSGILPLPKEEE